MPKGKKAGKSLREKEEELKAQLDCNIDIDGAKLTLLEVVEKYLESLYNQKKMKDNTKTGLRVSELCGLTMDDIDLENRLIRVEKQLQCFNHRHKVDKPKTLNGIRYIPMTEGVHRSFRNVLNNRYLKGDMEPVCYDEEGTAYEIFTNYTQE